MTFFLSFWRPFYLSHKVFQALLKYSIAILVVGIAKIPQIDDSTDLQTQHMDFLGKKSEFSKMQ